MQLSVSWCCPLHDVVNGSSCGVGESGSALNWLRCVHNRRTAASAPNQDDGYLRIHDAGSSSCHDFVDNADLPRRFRRNILVVVCCVRGRMSGHVGGIVRS